MMSDAGLQHGGSVRSKVSRRGFLGAIGVGGAALGFSATGARLAFAADSSPPSGDVLVIVFNRGGVDGLNLVAPFQMPTYRTLRPTIRVKDPGEFTDPAGKAGLPLVQGGAIEPFAHSGTFALHPGMEALHAGAWTQGRLAVVHAAGMPGAESASRSHFESQRNWEAGSGRLTVGDGFLNRHLSLLGGGRLAGVARGNTLSAMLDGAAPAIAMNRISEFGVTGYADNNAARTALVQLYARGGDVVTATGAGALDTVQTIRSLPSDPGPRNGAAYGWDDLSTNLKEVARLMRANVGLRVVTVDHGGWDTHNTQGVPETANTTFRSRAASLSTALQAFHQDLGGSAGVTVVCISEFGRTINENGSGGTDHGRGSAMLVMGANVRGGVHGAFPDKIENGPEGDLTVLNDYRLVLSEVIARRAGGTDLRTVFPTYTQQPFLNVVRA